MNIKHQPLLNELTENLSSYATVVTFFHVENVHVHNTRKTFKSATLQLATPFACLDHFPNYGTILPYFSAGGFIQACVCIPI